MKPYKKTTLWRRCKNAARAFQGKPARSLELGVKVKRCDKCLQITHLENEIDYYRVRVQELMKQLEEANE